MNIVNNTNTQTFKARFLYSKPLEEVAKYAIEHNKFDKLNNARKNIDSAMLRTRIKFDCGICEDGQSFVSFITYTPKSNIILPKTESDYDISVPIFYKSGKSVNPLKYALEILIKMGSSVPDNKIFKKVVYNKKKPLI